ncbi:MAG: 3'-5' exonuclease [Spirochaetales bacterium]|uniref:DNA 3'-5' helicase n=1 Tax=Candidatus Thalassospirochaeta sargassi TaxID=3119039 RepID=A0AAJ1IEA2_9SPIO|nr:3'-5' exonuclease [Spirochaetales bacterium]
MAIQLEKELNDMQCKAASIIEGPVLIIAGAGSGKTRMITFRIAHMLESGIPQSSILALTFTNKAAREMEERVKELTGQKLGSLTVSTFHAFGVKILRESIHHLPGYKENFTIYDQADKNSAVKEAARYAGLGGDNLDLYMVNNLISEIKTGRAVWDHTNTSYKPIFDRYHSHLAAYNAVDFDDLIIMPQMLFQKNPEVLDAYRERYKYIMVDEFQDTSMAQYNLVKLLGITNRNVCVVGDDDQSIYSWRGANYQNIVNFEQDFPEREEIKLEQNYRSTKNILAAANKVIANNTNRKEKELWTGTSDGKSIEIFHPENEINEAEFIAELIHRFHYEENIKFHDVGVLVRTNSLTATLEEAFLAANIPYKVSGGQSFFQRKEIKDIISYLRVISNPDDDVNLLRIINTPRRGIGNTTLMKLRELAEQQDCSIFSAMTLVVRDADSSLKDSLRAHITEFLDLINGYRERFLSGKKMTVSLRALIDEIDYWGYLITDNSKNEKLARWKFGNVQKFIEFFENWEKNPDNLKPSIYDYLNKITLITSDDADEEEEGKINLMTIHASKGLEFQVVFLAGIEDHIVPHARAIDENPDNIEEERRLFYVAITRAREKLFITSCRSRRVMRDVVETIPSRFLEEIPEELIVPHQEDQILDTGAALAQFAAMKAKFDSK